MRAWVFLVVLLVGCASELEQRQDWAAASYPGDFPTSIGKTWRTDSGIAVEGEANGHEIDFIVDTVYECLQSAVPTSETLERRESRAGRCFANEGVRKPFVYPKRTDIVVKIGDWHPSCANPKRQLLNVEVPEKYGCDPNKPRPPGCPNKCYWRGGFRYVDKKWLYITVPEFSMFPDTLVRSITACQDPYVIDRVRACTKRRNL